MNTKSSAIGVEWLRTLQEHLQADPLQIRPKSLDERGIRQGHFTPEELDQRAAATTRMAFRHRGKVTFVQLLVLPIQAGCTDLLSISAPRPAGHGIVNWGAIQEALNAWAPGGLRIYALRRVLAAAQLEYWSPETTRFLLEHALPGGTTFQHELALPAMQAGDGARTGLAFIVLVASSNTGWPCRLVRPSPRDDRLKTIIQFVLAPQALDPPMVGLVQPVSEGMVQGWRTWVAAESNFMGAGCWDLELDHRDADRWWVRFDPAAGTSDRYRLPLRAHLLGSTGLSTIASILSDSMARHSGVPQ